MIRTTPSSTRRRRLAAVVVVASTAALGASSLLAPAARAAPPADATACLPVVCGANYLGLPVDRLVIELDEDARAGGGAPIDMLVARIDAVAALRVAVAGRTDGPMQVAAMLYLRAEHDRVRLLMVAGATGEPTPAVVSG